MKSDYSGYYFGMLHIKISIMDSLNMLNEIANFLPYYLMTLEKVSLEHCH